MNCTLLVASSSPAPPLLLAPADAFTEDDPPAALDVLLDPVPYGDAPPVAPTLEDNPTLLLLVEVFKLYLAELEYPVLAAAFGRDDSLDTANKIYSVFKF